MNPVLVVGAGPAGLSAACDLSQAGVRVLLVERREELGGAPARWKYHTLAPDFVPVSRVLGPLIEQVTKSELVEVKKGCVVESFRGSVGDFEVRITELKTRRSETRRVSCVVVATGFEHFDARVDPRYGYGRVPDVIGINELEAMLSQGRVVKRDGSAPKRIAFVFCVGSRDRSTNPWCCTVCCGVSIKQAIELKRILPDSQIYMIYMDVRTTGLWEKLYWDSMEKFGINYIRGRVGEVYHTGQKLLVKGEDTLVRGPFEALFDMVVLAVGMEPGEGTRQAASIFGLNTNEYGFLLPRTPNIHYDSGREGVYLAGSCVAPMSVEEAISDGSAAAMQCVKLMKVMRA